MSRMTFGRDLLETLFARTRLFGRAQPAAAVPALPDAGHHGGQRALTLAHGLLNEHSQSASVRSASALLLLYSALDAEGKATFLRGLALDFSPDPAAIRDALDAHDADPSAYGLTRVSKAAEAPRQELLRRLNQSPMATAPLVAMRADLLRLLPGDPDLRALDEDFLHLLRSWFNRGFLVMRRIDWSSPADLLERIIRYEAVHMIDSWDALRDRLRPSDRRCYGFFHPAMGDEPLIFVEVGLGHAIPDAIDVVLAPGRPPIDPASARVATFYSISNCQAGLAGISFGQLLIKQVVDDLSAELPGLETFVTLSPIPGLAGWVAHMAQAGDAAARAVLDDGPPAADWLADDPRARTRMALTARYLVQERDKRGRPADAVARFHLGNGARVERLCWMADRSAKGMAQSGGVMVNYLYDLPRLQQRQDDIARLGKVSASDQLRALLGDDAAEQG